MNLFNKNILPKFFIIFIEIIFHPGINLSISLPVKIEFKKFLS